MAIRYAIASGNWSNPAVWDGGVSLPGAGDTVYTNAKTISIDQDIDTGGVNNYDVPVTDLIVGCFYKIKTVGNTVWTALGAASSAQGVGFLATGAGIGTGVAATNAAVLNVAMTSPAILVGGSCTIQASRTLNCAFVGSYSPSAALLTINACEARINGPIHYGGSSQECVRLAHASSVLTLVGDVVPLSASSAYGISGAGGPGQVITITGNVYGANSSGAAGAIHSYYPNVTINGNVYGATGATSNIQTIYTALAPGRLVIVGDVYGGPTGAAIKCSTGGTSVTLTGNCYGGSKPNGSAIIFSNSPGTLDIAGDVFQNAADSAIRISAGAEASVVRLVGNVYAGGTKPSTYTSSCIYAPDSSLSITGDVYASEWNCGVWSTGGSGASLNFIGNEYDHTNGRCAIIARKRIARAYDGSFHRMALDGISTFTTHGSEFNQADPADVRFGLVYNSGTLTGTCHIPPHESVAFGAPVDDTFGTAILSGGQIPTATDFLDAFKIEFADEIARVQQLSTISTTGSQLVAFNAP